MSNDMGPFYVQERREGENRVTFYVLVGDELREASIERRDKSVDWKPMMEKARERMNLIARVANAGYAMGLDRAKGSGL